MYNNYNSYNPYGNNNHENMLNANDLNKNNSNNSSFTLKKIIIIIMIIILLIVFFLVIRNRFKSYKLTINLNGADEIINTELRCKNNIKGECFVTLPDVKRTNGEVIGYSVTPESHNREYKIGDELKLTNDINLFVISKKINRLIIDKSDIDDLRDDNISCEVYNTNKSCEVNIPMFNKLGYKIDGYTKDKDNKSDIISLGSKLSISDNVNLYPVYSEYPNYTANGNTHFNIDKSVYINNTYLDIGKNCDSSIANKLANDLKKLYDTYPFYAYYSKLSILSADEYDRFSQIAGFGRSSGFTDELIFDNPTVVIKCDNSMTPFIVAIHELSHALDVRYKNISGRYFNEEKELIDLRNKYSNTFNRPLRDYAYSDKGNSSVPEFFAELITYYYLNHVDTSYSYNDYSYRRGNFPDDMKKMAEKYLCIGRNGYDKTKCS